MATIEETMDNSGTAFPAVDATREIDQGAPETFPDDPISSDVAVDHFPIKETETETETEAREGGEAKTKAEAEKNGTGGIITSVLMFSGVVVAAIGVSLFITKKMKET